MDYLDLIKVKVDAWKNLKQEEKRLLSKSKLLGDYSNVVGFCNVSSDEISFSDNNLKYLYDKSLNFRGIIVPNLDNIGASTLPSDSDLFIKEMEARVFTDNYYVVFYNDVTSQYVVIVDQSDYSIITAFAVQTTWGTRTSLWKNYIRVEMSFGNLAYLISPDFKTYKISKERVVE